MPSVTPKLNRMACPEGCVTLHLSGGIKCSIKRRPDFSTVRDGQGFVVGEWDEPQYKSVTRQTVRNGYATVRGCRFKFTYQSWETGTSHIIAHMPR